MVTGVTAVGKVVSRWTGKCHRSMLYTRWWHHVMFRWLFFWLSTFFNFIFEFQADDLWSKRLTTELRTRDYSSKQPFDGKLTNVLFGIPYSTTRYPTFPSRKWLCSKFQRKEADKKCRPERSNIGRWCAVCLAFRATRDAAIIIYSLVFCFLQDSTCLTPDSSGS